VKMTIFVGTLAQLDANHVIFAREFIRRGDDVRLASLSSLAVSRGSVHAETVEWKELDAADGLEAPRVSCFTSLEYSDLCWIMNQPHPAMAIDIWQILWNLNRRVPFVNDVGSLLFMNNKSNLTVAVPEEHLPETYVSASEEYLCGIVMKNTDRWVLKPTNGGAGNNVFVLETGGQNSRALIQNMTGSAATQYELFTTDVLGIVERHAVVQRYLSQARGEVQRVLVCCGQVILNYGRRPAGGDHRSNYTHGGELTPPRLLTNDEQRLAHKVAQRLAELGIRFAGLDMAYPYVLELNLANPGGVVNFPAESAADSPASRVADLICGSLTGRGHSPAGEPGRDESQ